MELEDMKIAGVIAWALVWSIISVSFVTSVSSWIVLVAAGVLPLLMILLMWHPFARAVPAPVRVTRK